MKYLYSFFNMLDKYFSWIFWPFAFVLRLCFGKKAKEMPQDEVFAYQVVYYDDSEKTEGPFESVSANTGSIVFHGTVADLKKTLKPTYTNSLKSKEKPSKGKASAGKSKRKATGKPKPEKRTGKSRAKGPKKNR